MGQKAILTFEDDDDGAVKIKLEFDPEIRGDAPPAPSVYYALKAMQVVKRAASEESDDSDD